VPAVRPPGRVPRLDPAETDAAIRSAAEERRVVLTANLHAAKAFLGASTGALAMRESFTRVVELMRDGRCPSEGWTETIAFDDRSPRASSRYAVRGR
jgi:hypothetical protein